MDNTKFRAYWVHPESDDKGFDYFNIMDGWGPCDPCQELIKIDQYTGLHDKNGEEYYVNDIGEFDNGDRFVIKLEWWLEIYIDWIGDPECEDQARDAYRIERAKIIGNIHENPELLI